MNALLVANISRALELDRGHVAATIALLAEGATVPFIARYRKERTGGFDEVQIGAVQKELLRLQELDKRRSAILESLERQDVLTPELRDAVEQADSRAALEDVYLPFRPKRRTRASVARAKGLEPLANRLLAQDGGKPRQYAEEYVNVSLGVETAEAALEGALDIVAERISEDTALRAALRRLFADRGILSSRRAGGQGADERMQSQAQKYLDYFSWDERATTAPSHRILAIFRGEKEKILSCRIAPPEEPAIALVEQAYRKAGPAAALVGQACRDAYRRLLAPALENELKTRVKERADEEAVRVFARNLRELLMASPLGSRPVMAIDPGFRTGSKVVCLDASGGLTASTVVYALEPHNKTTEAAEAIRTLVAHHQIEAVAVGNGTGGREMFAFCRSLELAREKVPVILALVNESGASIYSASAIARKEFPDRDITVRGAVSIGRRLMDPLAELIKIDPKSIGVGQYQHDVDQKLLKSALEDTVRSCVHAVGVELNTASVQLLAAVSGLNERIAGNIVAHRERNGEFRSRNELTAISGIGPRIFEQCAGFLRIRHAANPLDGSAVHPESYAIVETMARDLGCTPADLLTHGELRKRVRIEKYVTETAGLPTLRDIMQELERPGRDPRSDFTPVSFADGVRAIDDLAVGMRLPGVVTNVAAFGAFVDIGVHQDGLVHISNLADHFVRDPGEVVKVGMQVFVTVISVDLERKRIGLSIRQRPSEPAVPGSRQEQEPASR